MMMNLLYNDFSHCMGCIRYMTKHLIVLRDNNIIITGNRTLPQEKQFFKLQQDDLEHATANYNYYSIGNNV